VPLYNDSQQNQVVMRKSHDESSSSQVEKVITNSQYKRHSVIHTIVNTIMVTHMTLKKWNKH